MAELGLNDARGPLPKTERPTCGARTRAGGQCQARVVPGKRRCRLHGGLSTGPKGKRKAKAKVETEDD
ncbi:HGGxSTG domain-containing protein [Ruegeria conchae]|uniref:HGGxSTG domain-containing protein n=1 Tax=Ruegeria conchae TaxID=981384 RepID=UPI0028833041|nr:HGGxSTG domain-containing protein [Ruegeria conchae]